MFTRLMNFVRQVIRRMIHYKDIEKAARAETPLSSEMSTALNEWYSMYINKAKWLKPGTVKSLNLPAFISSELARQIVLEMKWSITGKSKDGETQAEAGKETTNPRAEYLKAEFEKCINVLREKLEQGCAAGGMVVKPYTKDGHIYFDWTMDWSLYPIAFDDDGNLADVVFPDTYREGKTVYTRLERHTVDGQNVKITQRAFKSNMPDSIGSEISLKEVPQWSALEPEVTVENAGGQMFGWYKVAAANNIDVDSPMGASCFCKARDDIEEADMQYSRLLWEFEGGELAVDVDPTALKPKDNGKGVEMPKLNQRLFRAVDVSNGDKEMYSVFSPTLRDANFINGLNQIFQRIEDKCGLSRGTISDPDTAAKTATELRIMKQRSYATISDNQKALEHCLKEVIRAMNVYATIYGLTEDGEYEVSFEWDDSIITDTTQQLNERLLLVNADLMGKVEFRMWYFHETKEQAIAAILAIAEERAAEQLAGMNQLLPKVPSAPEDGE